MKSLDTNVLLYAINADCVEHEHAGRLVTKALGEPDQWIVADQVYFELYRLLRNPAVLSSPLSAKRAAEAIAWYRDQSGWLHCSYEPIMMKRIYAEWSVSSFAGRNTFGLVLAVTLATNGVREFHTRNVDDFQSFGLFEIFNPIDD